jgi:hypothetical protein
MLAFDAAHHELGEQALGAAGHSLSGQAHLVPVERPVLVPRWHTAGS